MENTIELAGIRIKTTAEKIRIAKGAALLEGAQVSLDLPFHPARYYQHGWQSWTLTAWLETERQMPVPKPRIMHPMHFDPRYVQQRNLNGSWLGAVETPSGQVLLLGSLCLDAHVELDGNSLKGWYESGSGGWYVACGAEQDVFTSYANLLGQRFGKNRIKNKPRVWCSWYSLYPAINEARLLTILEEVGEYPFDVFQIDDGWQKGIGDWEANEKFPSGMQALAARIKDSGLRPGLWLAPLLVVPSSTIYCSHPDWLLRDEKGHAVPAGFNWGERLYALDTTHPGVLDWLARLMKQVRDWGYDYIKLDFLYSGALPGKRYHDMPREAAFRAGMEVIRKSLGDAYLLTCGTPILPAIGLCDGMRVGPDVAGYWISVRDTLLLHHFGAPAAQNALRTSLNRAWLGTLVHADPDVVYFNSRDNELDQRQMQLLRDLALITGFRATSDLPTWLTPAERKQLTTFLQSKPRITQTQRYTYKINKRKVDFSRVVTFPDLGGIGMRAAASIIGWLANSAWLLRIVDRTFRRNIERKLQKTLGF